MMILYVMQWYIFNTTIYDSRYDDMMMRYDDMILWYDNNYYEDNNVVSLFILSEAIVSEATHCIVTVVALKLRLAQQMTKCTVNAKIHVNMIS